MLVLIILIAIGILGGYSSGIQVRYAAQDTLVTRQLMQQYQLGVQAVNAGQYDLAKQHFEFIIQNYPDFPGAKSAYTDLLVRMQTTPSSISSPTPTVSPTPDVRSVDAIYNNVVALLTAPGENVCGRDWDTIIGDLDSLRKAEPTYKTVQVDGMYYIALRNRGVCKIYPQTYEASASCASLNINLEGGIYDLTQAENWVPWIRMPILYVPGHACISPAPASGQDWVQGPELFFPIEGQ